MTTTPRILFGFAEDLTALARDIGENTIVTEVSDGLAKVTFAFDASVREQSLAGISVIEAGLAQAKTLLQKGAS